MSVFGILLVSLFGTLQASVLPDDFDETTLLQLTTRKHVFPILQQPLQLTQGNMSEQLDAIDKLLKSNRTMKQDPDAGGDSAGGDSAGDGDAGGTNLNSVKQMLEDQMEAYLLTLHTAAQSEWSTATGHYTACGTHRERRFDSVTGDVVLAQQAMHQARLKHQACRRSEKAWNTWRAMTYSPPTDVAVHNVDDGALALCEAMSNAQTLAQTYNDVVPVGKHECLVDQTSFEWSACTWEGKAREACNAYTTCIAASGLTDLKNRLRVDAAERRALWRTIGVLKCRIDELADGAAGTGDGDSAYVDPCADLIVDTAHLVLDLPDPLPNDCTDEQLPPLTSPSTENSVQCAAWMATEYSWVPSEAVVPVACAATCLGVHPPQPPSDCADTNTQCEFYRSHPSACGSFADGVGFQACNDCCYCRYSPGCGHCPPGYIIHQGGTACQECPDGQITNADSTACVDPEPCVASVDCSGHGTTNDLDKSDGCVCSCVDGYSGVGCSTPPPCDAAVHCSGHGATIDLDSTDGCECACDDGFEGVDCGTSTSMPEIPSEGVCPPFTQDLITAADWHFGGTTGHGHTCNAVCANFGKVCNEQSRVLQTLVCSTETFTELWHHAHPNAATNPTCNMHQSHCRTYSGTPFSQYGQNCYYFCPAQIHTGDRSVCDGNSYGHHDVLCACLDA